MAKKNLTLKLLFFIVLIFPSACLALMSSGQYTIFADTIEAGGSFSAEGDYVLEDTMGESPIGHSENIDKGYIINAGYQAMDGNVFEVTFNTTTVNLGNLVVGVVASSSLIITVTTTAPEGYVISLSGASASPITAVSDGQVTAGQEEYGIAVSGPDAAFADDRGIAVNSFYNLAASNTPVFSVSTELIFKASITAATMAGNRNHEIGLGISSNF